MKKMMYFGLAALILGLLSTACTDPISAVITDEEQEPVVENTMTFRAVLEQGDATTKTGLDASLNVVWNENDKIRVYSYSRMDGEIFTLSSTPGLAEGTFTGNDIGSGPYFAVYPASVAGALTYSDSYFLNISVPSTQQYSANSFGNGANISWSMAGSTNDLYFHNVFGAVSFTLTGTEIIKKINLYTRGTDILNGPVTITNLADSSNPWVDYSESPNSHCITLNCGDGVTLNGDGVQFIICVPAGAFTEGFSAEFIDDQGNAMIKSAKGSDKNKIERGVIRKMSAFSYTPTYRSAFLEDNHDFIAYSGVNATNSEAKQCIYTEGVSQYAYINTDGDPGSRYVRFQDWNTGYSLSFQIPMKTLTLNANPSVTLKAQGTTGTIASKTGAMKVIKLIKKRAWLYDDATKNGYIIKLED